MPNITMSGSYFTAQACKDAGDQVFTIKRCERKNVAKENEPEDQKWVVLFEETDTAVVLNSARLEQLVELFGTNTSEKWHGQKVTVYCDPKVSFGGKKVGGVAFKAAPGLFSKPVNELG